MDLSSFPGKKVLNLSLSGGSIGDSLTMLRHTSFFHRPETIVWGLEHGPLFQNNNGNSDLTSDLIAHDQWYGLRRFWKHLQRTLAMDMSIASWNILTGQSEQVCLPIMATHGHKPTRCLIKIMADEGGTAKAFAAIMNEEEYPETPPPFAPVMAALDATIGDYCQQGTQFRLFIQPLHALNELYWQKRSGKDMDDWKRALTSMTDKHQRQGCDIRLMDFGGINPVTAEEIPQMSGHDNMRYYWEHSHYSSEAGTMLLHRLFATPPALVCFSSPIPLSSTWSSNARPASATANATPKKPPNCKAEENKSVCAKRRCWRRMNGVNAFFGFSAIAWYGTGACPKFGGLCSILFRLHVFDGFFLIKKDCYPE